MRLQSIKFTPSVCACAYVCVCVSVRVCVWRTGEALPCSQRSHQIFRETQIWMQLVDVSLISPGAEGITSAPGSPRVCVSGSFNCWWRQPTASCTSMHHKEVRTLIFLFIYLFFYTRSGDLTLGKASIKVTVKSREKDNITYRRSSLRDNWTERLWMLNRVCIQTDEVWSSRTYSSNTYRSGASLSLYPLRVPVFVLETAAGIPWMRLCSALIDVEKAAKWRMKPGKFNDPFCLFFFSFLSFCFK